MKFDGRMFDDADAGVTRWGHWGPQLLIGAIVSAMLMSLYPPVTEGPATALPAVSLLIVVLTTWAAMRQHDRGLCVTCVRSMPLNPTRNVERFRRRLALIHLGAERGAIAAYLILLVASSFLVRSGLLPGFLALSLWAAVHGSLIYFLLAYSTHRRLQPWCPRCRGRGDGDDEFVTEPTPSGSMGR